MKQTPSMQQVQVFNQCYQRYYKLFAWRCSRAVKDDVVGSGIVQDIFLKVWLLRDQLLADDIYAFVGAQLKKAVGTYYQNPKHNFHARLFRLEELADPELLPADSTVEGCDSYSQPFDAVQQLQWQQLQAASIAMPPNQQQLLKLCLRYNFGYERIAHHLGGISDYTIAKQVETLLAGLKSLLSDTAKLSQVATTTATVFSGNLDHLQREVLRLRYELNYGFEQIATELELGEKEVKLAYARACRTCR